MTAIRKHKIFLVDDHPLVREWLTNLIQHQPDLEICGTADNAPKALQGIQAMGPDIAIIDISLSNTSGLELIKDVRVSCPQVRMLVLSMHEESVYAERALRAGARGYIMKRESTKKVIAAIRTVLEGKLHASDKIAAALAEKQVTSAKRLSSSPLELLSDRELEVFELLGRGYNSKQIAEALHISVKTVQAFAARIKDKLQLNGFTELLREAICWEESKRRGGAL